MRFWVLSSVEGVSVVNKMTMIEERWNNFDDWLIIVITVTLDFHSLNLAFAGVGHRDNVSLGTVDIAYLQGLCTFNHLETVGQMSRSLSIAAGKIDITFKFQQVTMAKSIGAWTLLFLTTLKDSPWFSATAQNCSISFELIVASGPTKFL